MGEKGSSDRRRQRTKRSIQKPALDDLQNKSRKISVLAFACRTTPAISLLAKNAKNQMPNETAAGNNYGKFLWKLSQVIQFGRQVQGLPIALAGMPSKHHLHTAWPINEWPTRGMCDVVWLANKWTLPAFQSSLVWLTTLENCSKSKSKANTIINSYKSK